MTPYNPRPIWSEIARLQKELNEALWEGDKALSATLSRELERLRMLESYGETHDAPH